METVEIQLPTPLAQLIRQEISSSETLSQIFTEALRLWLEKRGEGKSGNAKVLQALRQAGLVMAANEQRALAEAMITTLAPGANAPIRTQVEASLANLKVPLSIEIITMRGER